MPNLILDEVTLVAKSIYMANYKELPNLRFPPVWENSSKEVQEWVKNQARAALLFRSR